MSVMNFTYHLRALLTAVACCNTHWGVMSEVRQIAQCASWGFLGIKLDVLVKTVEHCIVDLREPGRWIETEIVQVIVEACGGELIDQIEHHDHDIPGVSNDLTLSRFQLRSSTTLEVFHSPTGNQACYYAQLVRT